MKIEQTCQQTNKHIIYAKRISRKFHLSNNSQRISFAEFQSAAFMGLCEAATRYDTSTGASFSTFRYYRITGAMSDLLRKRKKEQKILVQYDELDDSSLVSLRDNQGQNMQSSEVLSVEEIVMKKELLSYLKFLSNKLPLNEKRVIQMKYFKGCRIREICRELGNVNPSWVSKLHCRALENLKSLFFSESQRCDARICQSRINCS